VTWPTHRRRNQRCSTERDVRYPYRITETLRTHPSTFRRQMAPPQVSRSATTRRRARRLAVQAARRERSWFQVLPQPRSAMIFIQHCGAIVRSIWLVGYRRNDRRCVQDHQDGSPKRSYPTISSQDRASSTRRRKARSKKASRAAFRLPATEGSRRDSRSSMARSNAVSISSPVRRERRWASSSTFVDRMFMDQTISAVSTTIAHCLWLEQWARQSTLRRALTAPETVNTHPRTNKTGSRSRSRAHRPAASSRALRKPTPA
jgi:hypothetical protein